MDNSINRVFRQLKKEGRKALIPYITAGDPDLEVTGEIITVLEQEGADIVELGVPFSDPMADGPVIQRASERSLKKGTNLTGMFDFLFSLRKKCSIPIILFGYYNPFLQYGLQRLLQEASFCGVDAFLMVDFPPEESRVFREEAAKKNISLIYLLAPNSDQNRMEVVSSHSSSFIYYVSMTGVTGSSLVKSKGMEQQVTAIKEISKKPVCVGFGIETGQQAAEISAFADGVIVGSALVKLIEQHGDDRKAIIKKVAAKTRELRSAIR